jgi:hypothetical protein
MHIRSSKGHRVIDLMELEKRRMAEAKEIIDDLAQLADKGSELADTAMKAAAPLAELCRMFPASEPKKRAAPDGVAAGHEAAEKEEEFVSDCETAKPCSTCGKPIIFLRTSKGKLMPTNADTVKPGDKKFDAAAGHVSHFSDCPQSAEHRRA